MEGFRRQAIAWLAIVALLSNVLAAFAPTEATIVADDVLGPLVICATDGAKVAHGDGGSGGHAPSNHCPACRLIASFALPVPFTPTDIVFPAPAAATPTPTGLGLLAIQLSLGGIRTRAPPLSA